MHPLLQISRPSVYNVPAMTGRQNRLFDFSKAKGPGEQPDIGSFDTGERTVSAAKNTDEFTVSALVQSIKSSLASAFDETIQVVGEISNAHTSGAGHLYFSLKDARCSLECVMWRSRRSGLTCEPADGMEVLVAGRVDVYELRGRLQLQVSRITPRGEGARELEFRRLKEKLESEGLFDPEHKKKIPSFPRSIGVITSASGAAIRDIVKTLERRWPPSTVYVFPSPVQGDHAGQELARAVASLNAHASEYEIDTIIVSRGGGSLEDLWPFNDEILARAIFDSAIPVISGVGHEIDFTIADFTADLRAATPTAAAEAAVPDRGALRRHLRDSAGTLHRALSNTLAVARKTLEAIERSALFRDPGGRIRTEMRHVDELSNNLRTAATTRLSISYRMLEQRASTLSALHPGRLIERARGRLRAVRQNLKWILGGRVKQAGDRMATVAQRLGQWHPRHKLALARQRLDATARQLEAISYRSVLSRGYSVTRNQAGTVLRRAADARTAAELVTELCDGTVRSTPNPDGSQPNRESDCG